MKPLIVIGDKTSHGGTVITCSPFSNTHGKGWARVGDMVSCPRCRGVFPIAEGDQSLVDDGKAVAYAGCKTACGATLIASQMFSFTEPSSGAGQGAIPTTVNDSLMHCFGHVGAGFASAYEEESAAASGAQFRGRFQLVDATTGEPVRDQAVRVRSTGGHYLTGRTDENGFTTWVERDAREALAFDLIEDGKA